MIFISLIDSGCEAKDSQKSELNHHASQEPNGEKTMKEVLECWGVLFVYLYSGN